MKHAHFGYIKESICELLDMSESKGEARIKKFLKEHKINFTFQKKFKRCKNVYPLPFDFYIASQRILIEFNGKQHYKPINFFGGKEAFKKYQINDRIKKQFAKKYGYKLIVISYKQEKNIENILKKKLIID